MRPFSAIALLVCLLAGAHAGDAPPAPSPPLERVRTIALPGVAGRLEHLALDARRGRLFVVAPENGSLEVVSLETGGRTKSIAGLERPARAVHVPDLDRLVVACGDGSVRFFDGETLEPAGRAELGAAAHDIRYDAVTQKLFVGFGEGAIAAISAKKRLAVGKVDLGARAECFEVETAGRRIFVNVEAAAEVAVVDRFVMEVKARWRLASQGNRAMALDEKGKRLFVGCRTPPALVVLSTEDGKVVAKAECSPDAGDVLLDAARRRVYVCCGEGTVDVFERLEGDQIKLLGRVATGRGGARPALLDPASDRLFMAVAKDADRDAEIRVFAPR